jgi:hypothetical protein
MAFNRIAQSERKKIRGETFREEMAQRGWCLVPLPSLMLEELNIPHEIETGAIASNLSRYSPMGSVHAPAWVYGVFLSSGISASPTGSQMRWGILGMLLRAARDDEREQETVCAEMALNIGIPRPMRQAARNFIDLRRQEIPDDPP